MIEFGDFYKSLPIECNLDIIYPEILNFSKSKYFVYLLLTHFLINDKMLLNKLNMAKFLNISSATLKDNINFLIKNGYIQKKLDDVDAIDSKINNKKRKIKVSSEIKYEMTEMIDFEQRKTFDKIIIPTKGEKLLTYEAREQFQKALELFTVNVNLTEDITINSIKSLIEEIDNFIDIYKSNHSLDEKVEYVKVIFELVCSIIQNNFQFKEGLYLSSFYEFKNQLIKILNDIEMKEKILEESYIITPEKFATIMAQHFKDSNKVKTRETDARYIRAENRIHSEMRIPNFPIMNTLLKALESKECYLIYAVCASTNYHMADCSDESISNSLNIGISTISKYFKFLRENKYLDYRIDKFSKSRIIEFNTVHKSKLKNVIEKEALYQSILIENSGINLNIDYNLSEYNKSRENKIYK